MAQHIITASKVITAPAGQVYAIIADYQNSHPRILPKPPFLSLTVEEGGVGAGTVINFQMRITGRVFTIRSIVSEPEPGRVLVESNDNGTATTFTIDPLENGQQAQVTISTLSNIRNGFLGKIEGWFIHQTLYPIYIQELEQLAAIATA